MRAAPEAHEGEQSKKDHQIAVGIELNVHHGCGKLLARYSKLSSNSRID